MNYDGTHTVVDQILADCHSGCIYSRLPTDCKTDYANGFEYFGSDECKDLVARPSQFRVDQRPLDDD